MPHVAQPLRRALRTIADLEEPPVCIIATGDLTESGAIDEYRRLHEILEESAIPVYLIPGNHDRRDEMRTVFSSHGYLGKTGPVGYTIEFSAVRVIALDSSEGTRRGGYLNEERLDWLVDRLCERPNTPTMLAMHHPPFPTGVSRFDTQGFEGRDALGKIVSAHAQIQRIVCGHIHQTLVRSWCGALGVTAPSTAPTLVIRPRTPGLSWEPGGFLVHRCGESSGISTKLLRTAWAPASLIA